MFPKHKTILYFTPHQDDELLSMGVHLSSSVLKHHDVHVILCTDGSGSNVKNILKNGKSCKTHDSIHKYALSLDEFIQARDREFIDSCRCMGVPENNIHIPSSREVDGCLTVANAEKIIMEYLSLYGYDSTVCTLSPNNGASQHRDHKALGKAAEKLFKNGKIKNLNLFIEPYHYPQIIENPLTIPMTPTITRACSEIRKKIKNAISAYSYWNPDQQRYAVGAHSVSNEFNDFSENMCSYHYPNKNWETMNYLEKIRHRHNVWKKYQLQKMLYYSIDSCERPNSESLHLIQCPPYDTEAYSALCSKYKINFRNKDLQRIADGSSFWALVIDDRTVVSSCWCAYKQNFYVGESDIGFDMRNSSTALIYDANTAPEHRRKGYYSTLLQYIVHDFNSPDRYIIYTTPDNLASQKGILKAGFQYDGLLSADNGTLQSYLRGHNFSSFTRKRRFWGLKVTQ